MFFQIILFLFVIIIQQSPTFLQDSTRAKRQYDIPNYVRTPIEIEEYQLSAVSKLGNLDHFNLALANILIPRVVGTPGHETVKNFLIQSMQRLNWHVEIDGFEETTPNMGTLLFENVIATLNPNANKYLILACHYDSKYFPNEEFVGATDSAVPCAMLLNLAYTLSRQLDSNRGDPDISIKLVFFDGEEAFLEWSSTDSIYGARHLAAKWENENFLPKIHMLVLLDLLGAPDPTFYSFFTATQDWYIHLCSCESRLANNGLMEQYGHGSTITTIPNAYFQRRSVSVGIEDDHIPFLRRGVPILHVIPTPFPSVWHKQTDDLRAIDLMTVENLNRILRLFLIEYLYLKL